MFSLLLKKTSKTTPIKVGGIIVSEPKPEIIITG